MGISQEQFEKSKGVALRVIKRADVEQRKEYLSRHQRSMLDLLAELEPDYFLQLAEKIRLQKRIA